MSAPVIEISSLSRRFGETNAVDHLTLDVHDGEIFGFLGHNGAGKTTTVRLLNGVLEPTCGNAKVLGLIRELTVLVACAQTGVLLKRPHWMNVSQLVTICPLCRLIQLPALCPRAGKFPAHGI
jgi:ABC-2 type transport system ATP-binding protein